MDESRTMVRRESRLAVFEHVVKKEQTKKRKRFKTNRFVSEDSSPSESELTVDNRVPLRKQKNLYVKLSEELLSLRCDWNNCGTIWGSWEGFDGHLRSHADEHSEGLKCWWINCGFETEGSSIFFQHVSYHGYIVKLVNIGQNVLLRNDLPDCKEEPKCVSITSPDGYKCEWEYCDSKLETYFDFIMHVKMHTNGFPRVSTPEFPIKCSWGGCTNNYPVKYKLEEHVRTHTRKRSLACPTCFTLFCNKTKFCDHRRRQLSAHLQSYQCSQCLKLFPTERILRDHIRSHINQYKCTMCDMTCTKPSVLAIHIRFKHLNEKPFKCNDCGKAFVTKHNLQIHLTTHQSKGKKCEICDFNCRSKVGLENHYIKKHDYTRSVYECHCCKRKFRRGGGLTKHLMKVHKYHWPSGHSRFRYRKDQDGVFKLQTVRYESLEVTEEMMKSESMQNNKALYGDNYTMKYEKESNGHVLTVTLDKKEEIDKDVVITIDDVDEYGNVVKSQVMSSKEFKLEDQASSSSNNVVVISGTLPNLDKSDDDEIDVKEHHLTDATLIREPLQQAIKEEPTEDQERPRKAVRRSKTRRK